MISNKNKVPQGRETMKSAASLLTVSKGGGGTGEEEGDENFVMLEVFKSTGGNGAGRNGSAKKQKEKYGSTGKKTPRAKKAKKSELDNAIEGMVGKSLAVRSAKEEYEASRERDKPLKEETLADIARSWANEDSVGFNFTFIKNPQEKLDLYYPQRVALVEFMVSNVIDICDPAINKKEDKNLQSYIDGYQKINNPKNQKNPVTILGALAKRWSNTFRDKDELVEEFINSFALSNKMRAQVLGDAEEASEVSAHVILDVVVQCAKYPEVGMTDWRGDLVNVKNYIDTCSGFSYSSTAKSLDDEGQKKAMTPVREQFAKIERFSQRVRAECATLKL